MELRLIADFAGPAGIPGIAGRSGVGRRLSALRAGRSDGTRHPARRRAEKVVIDLALNGTADFAAMIPRYNTLSRAFRAVYGRRAKKIPLDAGGACPNRDGTISRGGCLFCNAVGSGTGLHHKGFGLRAQWESLTPPARGRGEALVAYLQSFSNTYGPTARLAALLGELAALPDLAGLCLGTRPDCLEAEKLALLAAFPGPPVRLELGLQSANDATLARINRGHDAACFARAVREAAAHGIGVTAHVMWLSDTL